MEESSRSAPEDRISQLPDEILHQIFAFSTRDLILMARLSKRWHCLWKSSPFLNLEDIPFLWIDDDPEAYSRFVDTVLLLRDDLDVYSFRLSMFLDVHPHGDYHLDNWVQYAVQLNAKVIELNFHAYQEDFDLPPCIFACQSVEELRLFCGIPYAPRLPTIKRLNTTVQLGQLKKLHLKRMDINGAVLQTIISGCPVVEELVLERCWHSALIVYSPTLRVLIVEKCIIGWLGILIGCPRLVSFRFACNIVDVSWDMVLHLLSLRDEEGKLEPALRFEGNPVECIRGLANTKTIKMISTRLEFISEKELAGLPTFSNLENLTLGGWRMSDKFLVIAHFIQHSPNLQMLILTNEEQPDENDAEPNDDSHEAEDEAEASQNHSHETEAEHSKKHKDEGQSSQEHAHDDKCESRKELKQLWFHCAHTVITCRVQCGEENGRLVDLVSKAIVSKYTLPDHNVRIIDSDETHDLGSC